MSAASRGVKILENTEIAARKLLQDWMDYMNKKGGMSVCPTSNWDDVYSRTRDFLNSEKCGSHIWEADPFTDKTV